MTQLAKLLLALLLSANHLAVAAPVNVLVVYPRQLAGEGSFFDSVFTDTDNGVGYGVENAEDNLAEALGGSPSRGGGSSSSGGSGSGGPPPPPPPPPKKRSAVLQARQGNKIADGAAAVLNALGQNQVANIEDSYGNSIDGELTDGAANLGSEIGSTEESTLEGAGNDVPNHLPGLPGAPA